MDNKKTSCISRVFFNLCIRMGCCNMF